MKIRVGIVCSSGGSVFLAGRKLLLDCGRECDFFVVTDRECGAESACVTDGIPFKRIVEPDRRIFSKAASKWLIEEQRVDLVCLFFLRIVGIELLHSVPCFNIHPSLLPAFPGFNAIRNALNHGVRFMGTTLHLANEGTDTGSIIAQTVYPIPACATEGDLNRISFAQKVYIFLNLIELWSAGAIQLSSGNSSCELVSVGMASLAVANPTLRDSRMSEACSDFIVKERIQWHL